MSFNRVPVIGVIGAGKCSNKMKQLAEEVGRLVAERGGIVVSGGMCGVMEAASKGAKRGNGLTIGILPTDNKNDANEFIDIVIPSGFGQARNFLIVNTADAVIALPGKFGTLSEMAYAMKSGKPLVSVSAWAIDDKIEKVETAEEAVELAFKMIGK